MPAVFRLIVKTSLRAQPCIRKCRFAVQIKLVFAWKVLLLKDSFWNRGTRPLQIRVLYLSRPFVQAIYFKLKAFRYQFSVTENPENTSCHSWGLLGKENRLFNQVYKKRKALGSRPLSQNFIDPETCHPRTLMTCIACVTRASNTVLVPVFTNVGMFIQYIGHKYCICKEIRGIFSIFNLAEYLCNRN